MKKNILLVIALMLFATFGAFAQVPADFSIQGYAEDASNQPYNGTINVVFEIYDVATGGTSIYSQTEALTATAGYFEFRTDGVIGSQITAQAKNQLWYQFTIENVAQARVPFAAVPYSITSKWSESAFLADSATPSGNAGGHLEGTYPNPTLNENAVGTLIENYVDSKGIQAVPKGPAGGDIGGNYPNELLIKDRAVKSNHIALNAVRGENLADNTVTAVKIADNAVTLNKLEKGPTGLRLPLHLLVWNPLAYDSEGRLGNWEYASIASAVVNGIDAANSYSIPYVMPGATPATNSLGSSFLSFYPAADVDAVGNPAPGVDVVTVNDGGIFHTPTLYVGTSEAVGSAYVFGDLQVTGNTTVENVTATTEAKYATGPVYGTPYTPEVATTPDNYTDTRFASIGLLNYKLGVGVLANIRNNLPEGQIPFYSNAVSGNFNATSPLAVVNPTAPTAVTSSVPYQYSLPAAASATPNADSAWLDWGYMPRRLVYPQDMMTVGYFTKSTPTFPTYDNMDNGNLAIYTKPAYATRGAFSRGPLNSLDRNTVTYRLGTAATLYMPSATPGDSVLATVGYVKNSGLTNSNIWSSNNPTAARDLKELTNLFDSITIYPTITNFAGFDKVNTEITGNVLFSPNATDDKSSVGYIYMPYSVLTIGQVERETTSNSALFGNAEGLLNVLTGGSKVRKIGLNILPGLAQAATPQSLTSVISEHTGLVVDFSGDYTNGLAGAFIISGGDASADEYGAYNSASIFAANYDQLTSMNAELISGSNMFTTPNPALAIVGTSEFQGAMVARPTTMDEIADPATWITNGANNSKAQYGTIFTHNSTTALELGRGWNGQIIYVVNTGAGAFNVTYNSATLGSVAIGQAMNLIYIEDTDNWYPVK